MEKAELSGPNDVPASIAADKLPIKKDLNKTPKKNELIIEKINFNCASLTDIMTLHGMEEDLALEIHDYTKENVITDSSDLLELESIDEQMIKIWNENLDDMRVDVNKADEKVLKKIKGIGAKLAKIILDYKKEVKEFKSIDELKEIEGIGKNKLAQLKSRLKVGE